MNPTEEKVYTISYDREKQCVLMKWNGYSTSTQFKNGTELMLQLLIENNAKKVLADIKNMTIIGLEDQKWIENDFLPRATKHGFKFLALVKPSSYFNAVAMESLMNRPVLSTLNIRMFDTVEEAQSWLDSIG
jgi:hypothetical protein